MRPLSPPPGPLDGNLAAPVATVLLDDFIAHPDDPGAVAEGIRQALDACRAQGARILKAGSPRYRLSVRGISARSLAISNHDEAERRFAFDLRGLRDLVIDGQGAELLVQGRVIPFVIEGCANVTLRNFTIDWERPFASHGLVRASSPNRVVLEIPDWFPCHLECNRLVFTGQEYRSDFIKNFLEFDAAQGVTAAKTPDHFELAQTYTARGVGRHTFELCGDWGQIPMEGNLLAIYHDRRECPAMVLHESRDISIHDVTVHHAGAMALIAQSCKNIDVRGLRVALRPDGRRITTAFADATHFVECRGSISLRACLFENQLDDAANLHGYYLPVVENSGRLLRVRLGHFQQEGFCPLRVGDELEFHDAATLRTVARTVVVACVPIDRVQLQVEVCDNLRLPPGPIYVCISSNRVQALFRENRLRGNRARGLLFSARGRLECRDNHFATAGSAVHIPGGVDKWHEAGPVDDVLIQGNHFDGCGYGIWGCAVIDVRPHHVSPIPLFTTYHHAVEVHANHFEKPGLPLLAAEHVAKLTWRENKVEPSTRAADFHLHAIGIYDGPAPTAATLAAKGECVQTSADPPRSPPASPSE